MFLLAFYGFFWIGELAAKSATSGGAVVQYNKLRFVTQKGIVHMIKITITNFKHNTTNRSLRYLDRTRAFLAILPSSDSIFAKTEANSPGHFFAMPTLAQSQLVSSILNYNAAWYFAVSIQADIKVIAFALNLAPFVTRLTRVFLTPRIGRLAFGNPMRLKFISGSTPCRPIDYPFNVCFSLRVSIPVL